MFLLKEWNKSWNSKSSEPLTWRKYACCLGIIEVKIYSVSLFDDLANYRVFGVIVNCRFMFTAGLGF